MDAFAWLWYIQQMFNYYVCSYLPGLVMQQPLASQWIAVGVEQIWHKAPAYVSNRHPRQVPECPVSPISLDTFSGMDVLHPYQLVHWIFHTKSILIRTRYRKGVDGVTALVRGPTGLLVSEGPGSFFDSWTESGHTHTHTHTHTDGIQSTPPPPLSTKNVCATSAPMMERRLPHNSRKACTPTKYIGSVSGAVKRIERTEPTSLPPTLYRNDRRGSIHDNCHRDAHAGNLFRFQEHAQHVPGISVAHRYSF